MKTDFKYLLAALVLLLPACQREMNAPEVDPMPEGPVSIDVTIDQDTRTSVSEMSGAISFSMGDRISITDGEKIYTGITSSTSSNGTFAMEDGFDPGAYQYYGVSSTFVGFPAEMVANMDLLGEIAVQFILPGSYQFNQVGGKDFDKAKVPCPMAGLYTAGGGISLKPVCSVVRLYITNVAAGTLSFIFPTPVTGKAWVRPGSEEEMSQGNHASTSCPTEIQASGLTDSGNTVTVYGVPETSDGEFLCITLPVPVGTVPQNVLVTNQPDYEVNTRAVVAVGSSTPLVRAAGHRLQNLFLESLPAPVIKVSDTKLVILSPGNLMAHINGYSSPVAIADHWRFGGPFDVLGSGDGNTLLHDGNSDVIGKWVDKFFWQGETATVRAHGLFAYGPGDGYYGSLSIQNLYDGCWNTRNNNAPAGEGYIHIDNGGNFDWRPMTADEMSYMSRASHGAKVNGVENTHLASVKINGVSGILIFPESSNEIWNFTTMGDPPVRTNPEFAGEYSQTTSYTALNWLAMAKAGIVFMVAFDGWSIPNLWTSTGFSGSGAATSLTTFFNIGYTQNTPYANRSIQRGVRLVHDVE